MDPRSREVSLARSLKLCLLGRGGPHVALSRDAIVYRDMMSLSPSPCIEFLLKKSQLIKHTEISTAITRVFQGHGRDGQTPKRSADESRGGHGGGGPAPLPRAR